MIQIARTLVFGPAKRITTNYNSSESVVGKTRNRSWLHRVLIVAILLPGCHSFPSHSPQPSYVGSTADTKLERWLENHPKVTNTMLLTGVGVGATAGLIALGALYIAANSTPDPDNPPPAKKKSG
jgi:hypothetical protein